MKEIRMNLCRASWMLALLFVALVSAGASTPAERINSLLKGLSFLKTSEVGIVIHDLTTDSTLYRHQAEKLYRPASVEKVVTSVTALSLLGNDHQYQTRLAYTGNIQGDTLKGDLYVVGDLDPEFMEEDMNNLASAVEKSGIRVIEGCLKGDVSMMDSVYWGPGWSWDDTPESFQPYLSPLMLNRGCVDVSVSPAGAGLQALVEVSPKSDYYQVRNRSVSSTPASGNLEVTRDWLTNGNTITVEGNVAVRRTSTLNIFDSKNFFLSTLRYQLADKGIQIPADSLGFASCPSDTVGLYTCSRSLSAVLKQALKESDNLCAEALFFHAARKYSGKKALNFKDGQKTIKHFIESRLKRDARDYRIADGSGVSLYNYISPELLADCLRYAYKRPEIFQPLYASLPIAGIDGTLQFRMKEGKAFRNVRAKTGSVTGVSSLAGYVKAANGHWLSFVIINQNVLRMSDARRFQDRLCQFMATEIK